jgi:hypothetical protein
MQVDPKIYKRINEKNKKLERTLILQGESPAFITICSSELVGGWLRGCPAPVLFSGFAHPDFYLEFQYA